MNRDQALLYTTQEEPMTKTGYSLNRELPDTDYDDAVARVTELLKGEGFGILTEIDVKATLKNKLDVDFRRYVILGACNPPLAHRALEAEPDIGVLLPCNVVVAERDGGGSVVSAMDPVAAFRLIANPEVQPVAADVRQRLQRVLERLA
jgi:uncharacterized protein (DUF302 family)